VSLAALKWRVAAAILLAFAILPVAFGEDGAPEESLAEQLSADTEAGVLSEDEAAIYAFLALFAPDQLPTSYKSLSVDVPHCATGVVRASKDAATRVSAELSAEFEAHCRKPARELSPTAFDPASIR
jgi:hypothetical protein